MLTTTETAYALACCRATVRNLIHAGKLPAFKVGKNWRITTEALQQFIRRRDGYRQ